MVKNYQIGRPKSEASRVSIQAQSTFNTRQIEMLNALCTYVIDNYTAKPKFVKAPFTQFDRQGFPGVFKMDQINEILSFTEALTQRMIYEILKDITKSVEHRWKAQTDACA